MKIPTHRPKIRYATIFVFPPPSGNDRPVVSTTPDRLTVSPGDVVDWTIVDATGAFKNSRLTIGWKERSPFEKDPSFRRGRASRVPVARVPTGRYRYSVVIDGEVVFDPEVEVMN